MPSKVGSGAKSCGLALVVDDDHGCRLLLADTFAEAGFDVVEAATGEEALALTKKLDPRVAILDVRLPGISGYGVCRSLRERFGDGVAIVFVSGERTEPFDFSAGLAVGADDYVAKPFSPEELLARVHAVLRRMPEPGPAAEARGGLTRREIEVLGLLAQGLAQAEIAQRLVISPRTVATHIEHILEKLGARSRTEAVALAFRHQLVSV